MKGIGRLGDRGPIPLQNRHPLVQGVFSMPAAVPQVANAFHVAPEKRLTGAGLRRNRMTGRKRRLFSNRQVPAVNRP